MPELADPLFLLALPVPLLLLRFLPARAVRGSVLAVPESVGRQLLSRPEVRETTGWRRFALPGLIWVLLVIALAGPRLLEPVSALKVSGRDLAIVIDLSGSMIRDDFELDGQTVTRLEAVQTVGAAFARRRGGDRVALIVFGSEAYYAAPFTHDVEAIARAIETAQIGVSGRATNISDGLGLALKRMQDSPAATRVVILLSDGVNNAGATNPRGVARLASDLGVRVHTIALGPKDLASAEEGERGVVDAETLRAVSDLSGGESFRVKTTEDLLSVTEALDQLEPTEGDGLAAEVYKALWIYPAGLAVFLALVVAWREREE